MLPSSGGPLVEFVRAPVSDAPDRNEPSFVQRPIRVLQGAIVANVVRARREEGGDLPVMVVGPQDGIGAVAIVRII